MKKKAKKLNKKISDQSILHKFENLGGAGVYGEKRLQEVFWHVKKETKMSGTFAVLLGLKKLSPGVSLRKQLQSGRTINKVSLVSPSRTYYDAINWLEDGARAHDNRTSMGKKLAKDLRDVVRAKDLRGGTGYALKYKKEFYETFRESRGISVGFRSQTESEEDDEEEIPVDQIIKKMLLWRNMLSEQEAFKEKDRNAPVRWGTKNGKKK